MCMYIIMYEIYTIIMNMFMLTQLMCLVMGCVPPQPDVPLSVVVSSASVPLDFNYRLELNALVYIYSWEQFAGLACNGLFIQFAWVYRSKRV